MPAFRFRAQAALDLRRREYEQTQRELAEKQRDLQVAQARFEQACAAVIGAGRVSVDAQSESVAAFELDWYRFWIVRLVHERQAHALAVSSREQRVADAVAACQHAHQRCEALEKFRDKAKRAHDAAESATERKLIDELAARRYVSGRAIKGE